MDLAPLSAANAGAPRHQPDTLDVTNLAWRVFAQVPDLLNGSREHFQYIFVSAGIHAAWYWPDDASVTQNGACIDEATLRTAVTREAAVYVARFTEGAILANPAQRIAAAVQLAWCRVIGRRAWGIAEADLSTTERVAYPANMYVANNADAATAYTTASTAVIMTRYLRETETWYEARKLDYLPKLALLAIGTPVTNGVTLVMTNTHHFVEPHKGVQRAMTQQQFGSATGWPAECGMSVDEIEDVVYHKAFHPVAANRLCMLARSTDVKVHLKAMGLSGSVVRVPAMFQPERAVSAFRALVMQVSELAGEYNVSLPAKDMEDEFNALRVSGVVTPAAVCDLEERVLEFEGKFGSGIAWCGGFISAIAADARQVGMRRKVSILDSYAIKRVMDAHLVSSQAGSAHVSAVKRFNRRLGELGHLVGASVFGAPMPPVRSAPATGQVP